MTLSSSPLRYPGGKQILSGVLAHLIKINGVQGGTYAEPYAGGAGAALNLLFGEFVGRILINDADPCVHAFWRAILDETPAFLSLLQNTPLTLKEWSRQRERYQAPEKYSSLEVGFATFYLNRCNRSGIIANGGPIGGTTQSGTWKIDARFNRNELARRISKIALYRERIELSNLDAIEFLRRRISKLKKVDKPFVYLDPPYFAKGKALYLNYYAPEDHTRLAAYLKKMLRFSWVLTYDNVPQIRREYSGLRRVAFTLSYSARERRSGSELLIVKDGLELPHVWRNRIPSQFITTKYLSAVV